MQHETAGTSPLWVQERGNGQVILFCLFPICATARIRVILDVREYFGNRFEVACLHEKNIHNNKNKTATYDPVGTRPRTLWKNDPWSKGV
jgi:hypothetical protein